MPPRDEDFDASLKARYTGGRIEITSDRPLRSDEEPFSLSPVEVLKSDEVAYQSELLQWRDWQLQKRYQRARAVLSLSEANRDRFEDLKEAVANGAAVPFVGAGLSIPCGNPGWTSFLVRLAEEAGLDLDAVEESLREGEFEMVADDLIEEMTENEFSERLRGTFVYRVELRGAVLVLPSLFDRALITTNFDRVLEESYESASAAFTGRVIGSDPGTFVRALVDKAHNLLKIHGDVEDPSRRVLVRAEYNASYGESDIDFSLPLPRVLRQAFLNHTLVFLGCSLGPDRTMELWDAVASEADAPIPRHIAIIESPETESLPRDRSVELTKRSIFPIWYPRGAHEAVEDLLTLLDAVVNDGEPIDG